MMKQTFGCMLLALLSGACATQFMGSADYPGGVPACRANCQAHGMVMSAFVYAGEYSSACVCGERSGAEAPAAARPVSNVDVSAIIPAIAGVAMQTQRGAKH